MSVGVNEIEQVGQDGRFLTDHEYQQGWTQRIIWVSDDKPFTHCDLCGDETHGQIVCCVSIVPPGQTIPMWEKEFGPILTKEAVKLYLAMAKT